MALCSSSSSRRPTTLLLLLLLCTSIVNVVSAQPLASSQAKALLRVRRLLGYPPVLDALRAAPDPCALPPTPALTVACAGGHVTALSVLGDREPDAAWRAALPSSFSSEALFTTLTRLPALARLSLVRLGVWGPLPGPKLRRLQALQQLNLSSNYLYGAVPSELSRLYSLQSLVLSKNWFNGTVPSLSGLQFLEELDLAHNRLGPAFPEVGKAVERLVLADNNFTGRIPAGVTSLGQLQFLDVSGNRLQGWIPSSIFALPALRYINLSRNKLAGQLPTSTACAEALVFVDVSANLLTGESPACMRGSSSARTVLVEGNCFTDAKQQRPSTYCSPGALAAVLPPPQGNGGGGHGRGKGGVVAMVLGIAGGVVASALLIALLLVVALTQARRRHPEVSVLPKSPAAPSARKGDGGKAHAKTTERIITPADKRHASQAARVNTLEVPAYRVYTLEELQEATDNFSSSKFIKSSPLAQHYNGQLQDGSRILVRCLRLKPKYSPQSLVQYTEIISKLRHRHLASIIGHCIVNDQENPNIASSLYLISECVSNGSLRSHLTEWRKREMLKWPQRVSAAIGVARGIQFLHNVTAPGIVQNDLNIEKILLDKTLTSKINEFSLPMISTSKNGKVFLETPFAVHEDNDTGSAHNVERGDKQDIYQFGLILLEVITGKPTESQSQLESLKILLSEVLTEDPERLKDIADPAIRGTFAVDSLTTVAEIALNCTASDLSCRPSIDDVLWNLQYSMQVQDGWASSESLSLSIKSQG
ncbi:probable LRR receptor-like serine/threonine-protein kinase At1g14390 [Phragmites australis]|uniref:probable LRR receptor-like serine/threonine-protein kinase At1g14390 n=1 Tax=Phragmites australis TaxID=29695 RepID=UPI002D791E4E|nr:probable LRR receptor-like serine/threonine-protein kinase At1g14390 [Phragmites australis]